MSAFLSPAHAELLTAAAIKLEVAESTGVRSVTTQADLPSGIRWSGPGIVFEHHPLAGDPVPQYRPDHPEPDGEGHVAKYLFPPGPTPINVAPVIVDRLERADTVLVVEGTKQTLAAVSWAPSSVVVVGVAGCWGWSRDGVANPDLARLRIAGKPVVVAFDADVSTNRSVHDAAARLRDHLAVLGAADVSFVRLPASGTVGLDDFLATIPTGQRTDVLERLIGTSGKLGRRPAKRAPESAYFAEREGLQVETLARDIIEADHYAVAPDGTIRTYVDGVFIEADGIVPAVVERLGERCRDAHVSSTETVVRTILVARGAVLGDLSHRGLVNVANGMLRLSDGVLLPHDPAYLSTWQLAVPWIDDAVCPVFDSWLEGRVGSQAADLCEAAGLVLAPWLENRQVVFAFGPSRSGKSTFLRILEAVVGPGATCAVTLHALSTSRFAAAGLYGKALNSAGDLSDHHVDDLSTFKMLTGSDSVAAERKFRDAFSFRNRALFAFSANVPPTVSESSRAYLARVRPFAFPVSFEGHENPKVETAIMGELPGILVRLVEGARAWLERGGYAALDPLVAETFSSASDVAGLFASEMIEHTADDTTFVTATTMFDSYKEWAIENSRSILGKHKFLARLENTLGPRQKRKGTDSGTLGWRGVRLRGPDEDRPDTGLARLASFAPISPRARFKNPQSGESNQSQLGKIGTKRAKRARPEPEPDPDEIIREVF